MTSTATKMESPYEMKAGDKTSTGLTPTVKSYNSSSFMMSPDARTLRMLTEFQEPAVRLANHDVRGTILFFGSARSMGRPQYEKTLASLKQELASKKQAGEGSVAALESKIDRFKKIQWMCKYVDLTHDIAKRMTEWSTTNTEIKQALSKSTDFMTGRQLEVGPCKQPLLVTTGGGPGIMEAANKGATSIPGASTMGMGISLPFEKGLNPYVTPTLAFEFHYFFTRKYWMMYSAKALILGPGGFGTLDELFELLTLRQTGKLADLPIVLLGKTYWKSIINWQVMSDYGVISQKEVDELFFADDVDSACDFLQKGILKYVVSQEKTSSKKLALKAELAAKQQSSKM